MKYFKPKTMKKILILSILVTLIAFQVNAQNKRSGILEHKEQSVGFATGMDYSIMPVKLTFKQGFSLFNYKYPVTIGADVTVPVFAFDVNDVRFRIISETTLLRNKNFEIRGGIDPMLANIKMETESMLSLGADFHVFTGFTNQKWNLGLEANYNQIFSTHIKHTEKYKELVYADVVDGWYKNTASNVRIGILANRTINRFDIYVNCGISKTGKFNDYLFVPTMYALVGVTYRIK
jgi:hypothetical protein